MDSKLLIVILSLFGSEGMAADLNGAWVGQYLYKSNYTVPFTVSLEQSQTRLYGHSTEPNTFGAPDAKNLTADLLGQVDGNEISFNKTYDRTGGVSHTVQYRGTFDGEKITGYWKLECGDTGSFIMIRGLHTVELPIL
jgi:hypothetical protein